MYKLHIHFESDWHVGSGEGVPGSTDRTVLRDVNGLPYVPGKTLTGILRKSAALVASVYGEQAGEIFLSLFGEQGRRAKIGIGDAVFSDPLTKNILQHQDLTPALFIIQPGIKIDEKTGGPMQDHLFTREEVRGGVVLHAEIAEVDGLLGNEEREFLSKAVQATRGLGGYRSKGGGKCRMALEWDNSHASQGQAASAPSSVMNAIKGTGGVVELEFLIETMQPVIIKRASAGVIVQSETCIPGTQLVRHFVERIPDHDTRARIWTAVMEGSFSVGAFYTEVNGRRAYPAPPVPVQNVPDAVPRLPFSTGASVMYRTHSAVQKNKGFFTYQAIKPGQKFRGTLRIAEALWNELSTDNQGALLQATDASIGFSKKDEYGRTKITYVSQAEPVCHSKGESFVVYLASDVLLRNKETLAFISDVSDFKKSLEEILGIKLDDDPKRSHCARWGRRESWHSAWNLPRPTLVYLQAGSVFFFKFKAKGLPQNFNWDDAVNKLLSGIGDRVGEGYGRVLLNPQFPELPNVLESNAIEGKAPAEDTAPADESQDTLTAHDEEFFALVRKECLKTAFRKFSRKYIAQYLAHATDPHELFQGLRLQKISSSQLGKLRNWAAKIMGQQNIAPFAAFEGGEISRKWRQRITENNLWKVVDDPGLRRLLTPALQDELRIFTVSAFLDTLCEFSFDVRHQPQGQEEVVQ